MKKIVYMLFTICLLGMFNINVIADTTPTLQQIADKFNNHTAIKEYASLGSVWKASISNNNLIVSINVEGTTINLEYVLNNNVLSTVLSGEDVQLTGVVASVYLIDCISQFHGYAEGDIYATLQSEKIANYTVENEGLEMSDGPSGEYTIKVDISKKIPLLDLSGKYFEIVDLEDYIEFFTGDGFVELTKGYVYLYKRSYNGDDDLYDTTLYVAQKNQLTDSAYKSLLSVIEVMFNSKEAVNYFKEMYPNILSDKAFYGFKIEINPVKNSFEQMIIPEDSDYKFLRISINKDEVISKMSQNSSGVNDNQADTSNPNSGTVENPKTGISNHLMFLILLVIAILSLGFITRKNTLFKKI